MIFRLISISKLFKIAGVWIELAYVICLYAIHKRIFLIKLYLIRCKLSRI
jgi:endonuclease III-like uncharacterized protein